MPAEKKYENNTSPHERIIKRKKNGLCLLNAVQPLAQCNVLH